MKPKISMVVISYNGGKRLIPTLESHKLQTYKDKELIIADDASPDGITHKIIEDWLSENERYFKRVVFTKNQLNVGGVKNFRNATIQTTGDVIFVTEQGDLIYGSETIECISNEVEKQRLDGLKDPYIWLGHFKSFTMKNGTKTNYYFPFSTKNDFDLIKKYPDKALKKILKGNFICGASLIFSSRYFDENIYSHPETIVNLGDYPCLLWNLINKHRIGIIRQFIHWYEFGIGISSRQNSKMNKDVEAMILWIKTLSPDIGKKFEDMRIKEKEYTVTCKNRWQRMTRHPFIFTSNVLKYVVEKIYAQIWTKKVENESSSPFEEKMFSSQYYPDKPGGIF